MELLIIQFSSPSCHFIPLNTYICYREPYMSILKHYLPPQKPDRSIAASVTSRQQQVYFLICLFIIYFFICLFLCSFTFSLLYLFMCLFIYNGLCEYGDERPSSTTVGNTFIS
jgi:hypothetical protein